ncbi:hypothetical protein PFISCL1PPCAC_13932, partial [Pristionchus fissidentatus]
MAKIWLVLCAIQVGRILACFTESEQTMNARPVMTYIEPCEAATHCENACSEDTKCDAYAYIGTRCTLMGARVADAKLWLRGGDCGTPTTSDTMSTTEATVPTTTTTTAAARCGEIYPATVLDCPQCISPQI